jgi:hypothetical protein
MMLRARPAASLFAQVGPYVPCVGCDELTHAPFPEPGLWFNPDQSGSGFTFEFQNGVMAGYYYGYDADGDPEWYLVTGPLQESEASGVMWELEVEPQRFTGGNCMGCPYQAPDDPETLPAIRIEFLQMAYARITLSNGSIQYMVPIPYGDGGKAFFAEQTPYLFPAVSYNPYVSLWTLVFKSNSEVEHAPWTWFSGIFVIKEGRIPNGGAYEGKLIYEVLQPTPPPEVAAPFGFILCELEESSGEPVCVLIAAGLDPLNQPGFRIPIGNLTDSRFFGESEDGMIVQGFRLQYD